MRRVLRLAAALALTGCAGPRPGAPGGSGAPLSRRYVDGEELFYRIEGAHRLGDRETSSYRARGVLSARRSDAGVPYETVRWLEAWYREEPIPVPEATAFEQRVSLDPRFPVSIPDLSKVHRSLGGPITDLLTFYVDAQLAIRARIGPSRPTAYVEYGKESSWADGRIVLKGYDCIDFDVALLPSRQADRARLRVRHVPPKKGCEKVPAPWMRAPAADTPNNWFQVTRGEQDTYEAAAGKEVFDAELTLRLPSGVIESATMHNPVDFEERSCRDAQLTRCGPPVKRSIVRTIRLALETPPPQRAR